MIGGTQLRDADSVSWTNSHLNMKHSGNTIASLGTIVSLATIASLAVIGSLVFLRVCPHPHPWGLYSGGSRYSSYWRYIAVGFLHLEAGQPTAYLLWDYMLSWVQGFNKYPKLHCGDSWASYIPSHLCFSSRWFTCSSSQASLPSTTWAAGFPSTFLVSHR